jgi:phage shock protein A
MLGRIWKIIQAFFNKQIDSLENPELMIEQAIKDKEDQIREAKQHVQRCIASEKQTKNQANAERKAQTDWEGKAQQALEAGKEELAVKALQRASEYEAKANAYQSEWEDQKTSVDELKNTIRELEEEIAETKRNKDFIISQSKASEVKKEIYEAKAKIGKNKSADDLLARMKNKADRNKYEADAAKEMATVSGDSLEDEFRSMDTSSSTVVSADVNSKLAAMKAKMGQNQAV